MSQDDKTDAVDSPSDATTHRHQRRNQVLLWVLLVSVACFATLAGVSVWKWVTLEATVQQLSDELAVTTTTNDEWQGNRSSYKRMMTNFESQRSQALAQYTEARAPSFASFASEVRTLAMGLSYFPDCPKNVRQAQDDYFDALMNLSHVVNMLTNSVSQSSINAFRSAWDEEDRLLIIWKREAQRAGL